MIILRYIIHFIDSKVGSDLTKQWNQEWFTITRSWYDNWGRKYIWLASVFTCCHWANQDSAEFDDGAEDMFGVSGTGQILPMEF